MVALVPTVESSISQHLSLLLVGSSPRQKEGIFRIDSTGTTPCTSTTSV